MESIALSPTKTSNGLSTPRSAPHTVRFKPVLEEDIGRADADVNRADTWELPRTCDGCGLYVLPGTARFACDSCAREGREYDLCASCFKTMQRSEKSAIGSGNGKKRGEKRKRGGAGTMRAHEHPSSDFIIAEFAEEEEEEKEEGREVG